MGHEVVLYTVQGKYDYTQYEKETGVKRRTLTLGLQLPQMMRHIDTTSLTNSCTIFFTVLLMWPQCEFHYAVGKIIKENRIWIC